MKMKSNYYKTIEFKHKSEYVKFFELTLLEVGEYKLYTEGRLELPEPNDIDWNHESPILFKIDIEENRIVGCKTHLVLSFDWT